MTDPRVPNAIRWRDPASLDPTPVEREPLTVLRPVIGLVAPDLARTADPVRLLDPRPRVLDPMVAAVVERAPDIVLAAGENGEPVRVGADSLQGLLVAALGGRESPTIVWTDGLAELAVHLDRTRVATRPGFVVVALAVENGSASGDVTVLLAVGRGDDAAALLIAAEEVPHGPAVLVDGWGRAVVAAVVTAVLTVAADIAAASGHDRLGLPLLPATIRADEEGLEIVPRARLDVEEDAR
jgi:hypothetical protein